MEEHNDMNYFGNGSEYSGSSKTEVKRAVQQEIVAVRIPGIVKWFNVKRGYGFISRTDAKADIFMHRSSITRFNPHKRVRSVGDGEPVIFDIVRVDRGFEAANVTGPGGEAVRGSQFVANTSNRPFKRYNIRIVNDPGEQYPMEGAGGSEYPELENVESEAQRTIEEPPNRCNFRSEPCEEFGQERCNDNWREIAQPSCNDQQPGGSRGGVEMRGRGGGFKRFSAAVCTDASSSRPFGVNGQSDERGRGGARGRSGRARGGRGNFSSNVGADFPVPGCTCCADSQFGERGRRRGGRRGRFGPRGRGGPRGGLDIFELGEDTPVPHNEANGTFRGASRRGRTRGVGHFENVRQLADVYNTCLLTNTASSSNA